MSDQDSLRQTLQSTCLAARRIQEEIGMIQQRLNTLPIGPSDEEKWKILRSHLERLLQRRLQYRTAVPKLDDCQFNVTITSDGIFDRYEWDILLPVDHVGGTHFKRLIITNTCFLLSELQPDPLFIDYLVAQKRLNRIIPEVCTAA